MTAIIDGVHGQGACKDDKLHKNQCHVVINPKQTICTDSAWLHLPISGNIIIICIVMHSRVAVGQAHCFTYAEHMCNNYYLEKKK